MIANHHPQRLKLRCLAGEDGFARGCANSIRLQTSLIEERRKIRGRQQAVVGHRLIHDAVASLMWKRARQRPMVLPVIVEV